MGKLYYSVGFGKHTRNSPTGKVVINLSGRQSTQKNDHKHKKIMVSDSARSTPIVPCIHVPPFPVGPPCRHEVISLSFFLIGLAEAWIAHRKRR